jgi:hypothetical protein
MKRLLAGTAVALALGGVALAEEGTAEDLVTVLVDGVEVEATVEQVAAACPDVEDPAAFAGTGEVACEIDGATAAEHGILVAEDEAEDAEDMDEAGDDAAEDGDEAADDAAEDEEEADG